jgi:uncharacterized protein with von Willebrand factor type A (vWA) domain
LQAITKDEETPIASSRAPALSLSTIGERARRVEDSPGKRRPDLKSSVDQTRKAQSFALNLSEIRKSPRPSQPEIDFGDRKTKINFGGNLG